MLGVRLYVTPSSVVTKEGPDHPKERGIVGNAVAEVRSIVLTLSWVYASCELILQAKDVVQDLASIISGGQAPVMKAFSGTEGAVTPGNIAGGVMAAMETSSHSHGGNVKEDFVRCPIDSFPWAAAD
jgi:hypothetical protein